MSNTEPPTPHHETPALIAALSDSALCRASSAAIFQRGKTYATSGAVQVLSEEPGLDLSKLARPTSTWTYMVHDNPLRDDTLSALSLPGVFR